MNEEFYEKKWFKDLLIIGIPTAISVIGVLTSLFNSIPLNIKNVLIFVSIFLFFIFLYASTHYSKKDTSYREIIEKKDADYQEMIAKYEALIKKLKSDLMAEGTTIVTYTTLFEKWTNNIYEFAYLIKKNEVTDLSWNKKGYYDTICWECSNMIQRYCNPNGDNSKKKNVSVSFIEYTVDEKGNGYIQMVSDSNPQGAKPSAMNRKERLEKSEYYYAELIRKRKPMEVAVNNGEIRQKFKKVSRTSDLAKYTQYIAIPVSCSNNKILGIFQVTTEYDYIIESSMESLLHFAKEKVIPYTNLVLLVDKIHKGLYACPEQNSGRNR